MNCLWWLMLVLLAWTGCRRSPSPGTPSSALIFARGADAQKLDPADVDDGESIKVLNQICEGLVRFKAGTSEVEPCLATAWTITDSGTSYTFRLRDGVRFHDGTPLDAEAAAWSFHRQINPNHPGHLPDATYAYWSAMFSMVEAVEVPEPMLLRFRLRQPHAPLLASLAIPAASLLSPKFVNQRQPVGTGPFRFVEWVPNERITLEANPDYWDGAPPLARLVFKVVPDNATRLVQLETGQVHAMDGIDPLSLPTIRADPALRLITAPGLNVCYLSFNCERPPLDDPALRRAIAAAVNKDDLIQAVFHGAAVPARNPLPPFIAGHNDDIPLSRSPANDAKLAGIRPLTLHVMTNPRPYLPSPLPAAQLIKADLEKIRLRIEIVANEWGAHLSRTQRGEHDLALLGWIADIADADNFLYVLLDKDTAVLGSAMNINFWKSDPYHDLMIAARREVDPARRATLYRRGQEIIFEEAPMVPLAHAESLVAHRANVRDLVLQPNGDVLFHRARWE